jgi:arsenate reductase|tara:strand:- start:634 stop:996 length:363 start_codon:yes stop_codon:yes gene_type:complete
MAEGFGKQILDSHQIESAGIAARGLNPKAITVMLESGIDISRQTSDVIDEKPLKLISLVVTVCDDAEDICPVLPVACRKIHWSISDPAKLIGTEDEIMRGFRKVRDELRSHILALRTELY